MGEKGQALTEFILVLPVLLIIFLVIFNISYIYIEKYNLEKDLEVISDLYENSETKKMKAYISSEELGYSEKKKGNLVEINISKNLLVSAPFLNNILGKNFKIETSKTIYVGENYE